MVTHDQKRAIRRLVCLPSGVSLVLLKVPSNHPQPWLRFPAIRHYTLLRQGEFAYNKGNSLTSPQGCIFRLEQDSALVPHVYFCFSLTLPTRAD